MTDKELIKLNTRLLVGSIIYLSWKVMTTYSPWICVRL